jgi:hypothetical protein
MGKAEKAEAAPEAEWAEPEEEEAPHLGACVERAKSGRSLCKECRLPIAQDALRIGGAWGATTLWRHHAANHARADVAFAGAGACAQLTT